MKELWGRYNNGDWELIDKEDGTDSIEKLLAEYQLAYGADWDWEIR